ncbi:hypothetical protein [Leptothoe sp. PORK10 BA2]|uniref:hypothetical protein n=1 Tax=Leptothoe sp. PORK10 BA2 TaxID=3110254 RepID=UPI002B2143B0|nr:hypothetical protein [Leptothoe sp. PORK10 BA2]MEA5464315.1 hypothetical protein [Leptothoe sp. PORK10 BA2]
MVVRSIRKSVSFDEGGEDRALLDAIATHQAKHEQSFSDLCKQALRQYLLAQEPTQSVLLFMELQHQIAQLGVRVAALEDDASIPSAFSPSGQSHPSDGETSTKTVIQAISSTGAEDDPVADNPDGEIDDPVLSHLAPLLMDDF